MALLKIAVIFVDFLMLYVFPSNYFRFVLIIDIEKKLYAREKYMKTEDFSEFEERKKQQEEEKERRKIRKLKRKQRRNSDDEDDDLI